MNQPRLVQSRIEIHLGDDVDSVGDGNTDMENIKLLRASAIATIGTYGPQNARCS